MRKANLVSREMFACVANGSNQVLSSHEPVAVVAVLGIVAVVVVVVVVVAAAAVVVVVVVVVVVAVLRIVVVVNNEHIMLVA